MSNNTGVHELPGQNDRTRVARISDPAPLLVDAHEAFIVAYDRLNGLSRIARNPAVLVAAVDTRPRVVEAMILEAGQSLVIGRHTQCHLRLELDTIALRHLVVHASANSPEAAPAIRLWDLNSGMPFLTEDGQPNAAVIAQGPLYAAVGRFAFLFVPTRGRAGPPWPVSAEEAWKALPPREFIDRRTPRTTRSPSTRLLNMNGHEGSEERTNVTRLSPVWLLGDDDSEDVFGELVLQHGGQRLTHRISAGRMEQGVLLGRYDRCGIPLPEFDKLSRVHLLLVRNGDEVLAIDTASSNGTQRGSTEIFTSALREQDEFLLADSVIVHWRRL